MPPSPARHDDPEHLPGARRYLEVLDRIHAQLRPPLYLEIGVRNGKSLRLARGRAIGIDPQPEVEGELPATTRLHVATSDAWFAQAEPPGLDAPVDLAFIDGMHLFEYALRDFINVERHAAPWTLVVIDDVLPAHPLQAARERSTRAWMGDVWRLAGCLREHRPGLELVLFDAWPGGLLAVSGLDPANTVLADRYDAIVADAADAMPPPSVLQREGALAPEDARIDALCARLRERRDAG